MGRIEFPVFLLMIKGLRCDIIVLKRYNDVIESELIENVEPRHAGQLRGQMKGELAMTGDHVTHPGRAEVFYDRIAWYAARPAAEFERRFTGLPCLASC